MEPNTNYDAEFEEQFQTKDEISVQRLIEYYEELEIPGTIPFFCYLVDRDSDHLITKDEFRRLMTVTDDYVNGLSKIESPTLEQIVDKIAEMYYRFTDFNDSDSISIKELQRVAKYKSTFPNNNYVLFCERLVNEKHTMLTLEEFKQKLCPILMYCILPDGGNDELFLKNCQSMFHITCGERDYLSTEETSQILKTLSTLDIDLDKVMKMADLNDNNKIEEFEFVRLAFLLHEYNDLMKNKKDPDDSLNNIEVFYIKTRLYFRLYDRNDFGSISQNEIIDGIAKMDKRTKEDLKSIRNIIKTVKDGYFNIEEFQQFFISANQLDGKKFNGKACPLPPPKKFNPPPAFSEMKANYFKNCRGKEFKPWMKQSNRNDRLDKSNSKSSLTGEKREDSFTEEEVKESTPRASSNATIPRKGKKDDKDCIIC